MKSFFKYQYLIYFIPIPIFFTSSGIFRGSSLEDDAFALPLSLFVFFIVFALKKNVIRCFLLKNNILLPLMLVYSVIIFFLKIIFSEGDDDPSLLFVSVIPLIVSYVLGYLSKRDLLKNDLSYVIDKSVLIFSVFCGAFLLSSIISLGVVGTFVSRGEDSVFGLFSIYQKFIYFPTMTACYFALTLTSRINFKYFIAFIFLLVVLITGAREAILICTLAIFFNIVLGIKSVSIVNILKGGIIFFAIGALLVYFSGQIMEVVESSTFYYKLLSLSQSSDFTAGRSGAIKEVFTNSMADFNLFIGTGYSMNLGDFRTPHNQYAEVFLRSGFLGALIFLALIIQVIRNIVRHIRYFKKTELKYVFYSLAFVFFVLVIVSFNINVPVRVPYTSILFGFLCGFFNNLSFVHGIKKNIKF